MTINPAARVAQARKRTCEKNFADETPEQQAAHREIARKYSRHKPTHGRRRPSLAPLRIRELEKFYRAKFGGTMPHNDPRAIDCLFVLLHHVAQLGDPRAVRACAARWCPWLSEVEYAAIVEEIERTPLRWRADSLARRIGVNDAIRTLLHLKTIGANDIDKAARAKRRRQRNNEAKRLCRVKAGAKPHASSAERLKPWLALGISRRTYYRKKAGGTVGTNSGAIAFLNIQQADQCHDGGPSPVSGDVLARADAAGDKKLNSVPVDRVRIVETSDAEPLKNLPHAFKRPSPLDRRSPGLLTEKMERKYA